MFKTAIVCSFFLLAAAFPASAQEVTVPEDSRTGLTVTIYNQDLALIRDSRKVDLKKGLNRLAFANVSAMIRPETALVRGNGFTVLEQNFNFDLLDFRNMIEKSLGAKVDLVQINPGNGDIIREEGEIISNANGSVVLKIGDRIEASYPGRVIFREVPASLRSKPTLVLDLYAGADAGQTVDLSYLSGGLSWQADYVAELNDKEDQMRVNGLVTLTNRSGVSYRDSVMQLVAGNVNQVSKAFGRMNAKAAPMMALAEAAYDAGGVVQEAFMDFHLYTMPRKVSIDNQQTKQVALLAGSAKVEKEYIYDSLFSVYYSQGDGQEFRKRNPEVRIKFTNDEKQGLGKPLPAGIFRIYKSDSQGRMLFAGEDRIAHTPKNEEVRLRLGEAFDVTAEGRRTEFTSLGGKSNYEAAYELKIKNAKDDDITVMLYQNLPNNWMILSETLPHTRENSNRVLWKIPVAKNSDKTFTFKVRVLNN